MTAALLLVAHGSRDRRAAASTRALVRAVAAERPDLAVCAAFLDHTAPTIGAAVEELAAAGHRSAVLVPLLLTEAYHGRVDIPAALAELRAAGSPVVVRRAPIVGPASPASVDDQLVEGLLRRLRQQRRGYDALVLAAAGTRDAAGRSTVEASAAALGLAAGVPCLPAFASAADPTPGDAVCALRAEGARRIVVASYFLAPGLLHDRAVRSARDAGAITASAPLGAAPELVTLVLTRAAATPAIGQDLMVR